MSLKAHCFVDMPFGKKKDPSSGVEIDFDQVYGEAIRPAILAAGLEAIRGDEERTGGIIHVPMFGRLLLSEYLVADLTLDPPVSTGDQAGTPSRDDDWLTLSTVHSAKGGEWGVVHLIHAADGAFPSDMSTGDVESVDEERRLFYVALTRAQRHLHIYAPLRYHHGDPAGWRDEHSYAQRTRFLPAEVDDLLEHRAIRSALDVPMPSAAVPVTGTVDAELRGLW